MTTPGEEVRAVERAIVPLPKIATIAEAVAWLRHTWRIPGESAHNMAAVIERDYESLRARAERAEAERDQWRAMKEELDTNYQWLWDQRTAKQARIEELGDQLRWRTERAESAERERDALAQRAEEIALANHRLEGERDALVKALRERDQILWVLASKAPGRSLAVSDVDREDAPDDATLVIESSHIASGIIIKAASE
jgi:DNA repair exonuclease SbcCD ATPase subunit